MVKDILKDTTSKFLEYKNANAIIERIRNYEYVSFDIFDTLIKRNVPSPTDLFQLIEDDFNISNFKKKRIEAEKTANENPDNNEEVTLDYIYKQIEFKNIDRLKEIEIQYEIDLCTRHKELFKVFDFCIQNNKKVILISDMYLHETVIKTILKNNGYNNYDKLYLSSKIGLRKNTGNLFHYVLKDLNIDPSKMIHIGDNLKNDYIKPRAINIDAIHISIHMNHLKYTDFKSSYKRPYAYRYLQNLINNNIDIEKSDYFKFGYEIFGPVLYGFTNWLFSEVKKNNYKSLYFLARDGYILKRAFDTLYSNENINSHYLYMSRKSVRTAQFFKLSSIEKMIELVVGKKYFDIEYVLNSLSISEEVYLPILNKMCIDPKKIITKGTLEDKVYKELFLALKEHIYSNAKLQYEALQGYLLQEKVDTNSILVDIGWRGSIQKSLIELTDYDLKGYYLGVTSATYKNNNIKGYLFEPKIENDYECEKYSSFVGLIEFLFLAQEGSTIGFKYEENEYKPILKEYEYNVDSKEIRSVIEIQHGAMSFVEDIKKIKLIDKKQLNPKSTYYNLYNFGRNPKLKLVPLFGDFLFEDGNTSYMAKPDRLWKYCYKPKLFLNDFSNSTWKIGFFKRLFKLPFRYDKLYDFLKKRII